MNSFNKNILYLILTIFLTIAILSYGTYLIRQKYIVECFQAFDTGSPQTNHTVDLPINTKISCKNMCGPLARCSITGEQCTSDVDCYGCQKINQDEDKRARGADENANESTKIKKSDLNPNIGYDEFGKVVDVPASEKSGLGSGSGSGSGSNDGGGSNGNGNGSGNGSGNGNGGIFNQNDADGNSTNGNMTISPFNDNLAYNDAGKLTAGVTPTYSPLTTDIGTRAGSVGASGELRRPPQYDKGTDLWTEYFNNEYELFKLRYTPPKNLPFETAYPKTSTLSGEFSEDGPRASNSTF
jgi:hypothetical protein